ncbi:hypothetical protein C1H76_7903 [Elsinoe australis]|uniref:Uncharacterized protein n=1 Tax=Elsinoe australis TaxID=40998 RepID=A0A4U7AXU1_9PEZI|nr:hypothetical protein C1H76_7903 [Elsinoe australis]
MDTLIVNATLLDDDVATFLRSPDLLIKDASSCTNGTETSFIVGVNGLFSSSYISSSSTSPLFIEAAPRCGPFH